MVLYTAGIQLLTRIYKVLVLFIEGEKSKSEFFKKQIPYIRVYIFCKFRLNLIVNWTAMVYNWRLTYVLNPSSGSRGKQGTPPEHKVCRGERMRIDSRKNLKCSLNFSKFLLKFSQKLLKFLINLSKFVQTLTNFSQITIINLI